MAASSVPSVPPNADNLTHTVKLSTTIYIACGAALVGASITALIALLINFRRRKRRSNQVSIRTISDPKPEHQSLATCEDGKLSTAGPGYVLKYSAIVQQPWRGARLQRSLTPTPSSCYSTDDHTIRSKSCCCPEAPHELSGLGISAEAYTLRQHSRAPSAGRLLFPAELPSKRFSLLSIFSNTSKTKQQVLVEPDRGRSPIRRLRYARRVEDLRSRSRC
jgi:hypothetical protein